MDYLVPVIVFFLLMVIFLINHSVVTIIEKNSSPDRLIERVAQIDDAGFLRQFNAFKLWAEQNGFVHDGLFLAHMAAKGASLQCGAWWNAQQSTWVLMYFYKGKHFYDWVTKLTDGGVLSTSSSKDALILPSPAHYYVQAFANVSFDTLLQKHQASINLLKNQAGKAIDPQKTDVIQEMKAALATQAVYIKTLPFWQHKGLFWYVYHRNFLVNKPITI
ncbi:MAG: hypothetical protein HOP21_10935 [Methylotenera sp.]|nr:hypothetical protein [Methylotenera sp.]